MQPSWRGERRAADGRGERKEQANASEGKSNLKFSLLPGRRRLKSSNSKGDHWGGRGSCPRLLSRQGVRPAWRVQCFPEFLIPLLAGCTPSPWGGSPTPPPAVQWRRAVRTGPERPMQTPSGSVTVDGVGTGGGAVGIIVSQGPQRQELSRCRTPTTAGHRARISACINSFQCRNDPKGRQDCHPKPAKEGNRGSEMSQDLLRPRGGNGGDAGGLTPEPGHLVTGLPSCPLQHWLSRLAFGKATGFTLECIWALPS